MIHPPLKFVLDVHLAKLCRFLRMLGFDSLWKQTFDDAELLKISQTEQRILLTRDRELFNQADPQLKHYVVEVDSDKQLIEVLKSFSILDPTLLEANFLTRCLECNCLILGVAAEKVKDRILPEVFPRFSEYFECPHCDRVFWKGSHYKRMKEYVRQLTTP